MNKRDCPTVPVLEVNAVDIRYGGTQVVTGASFHVEEGEFVTLLGPSGSGKTSLLRTIAGFVPISAGEIRLRGASVAHTPAYQRDVGLVFQNYGLFPHMTVGGNLAFGPKMMKVPAPEIEARMDEALRQVRLTQLRDRYPHELSGGQQQRVAIARALAMRPSLLLLDEPMSNLDARLRAEMRVELVELLKRLHVTAVAVTHNQEEALGMSDRIVVMAEGGIRQTGTPADIYMRPRDAFVANFVGDANLMEATHVGIGASGLALFELHSGIRVSVAGDGEQCRGATRLMLRPESIELLDSDPPPESGGGPSSDNRIIGSVLSTAYMGSSMEVRAAVGGLQVLLKMPAAMGEPKPLQVGQPILMRWRPDAIKPIAVV